MSAGVSFELLCEKCGTDNSVLPHGADSNWINCNGCGEGLATVGQLNDEIVRQISSIMTDGLESRLRDLLGC